MILDKELEIKALPDPNWNYGGQYVGTEINPIQVTHKPSGITATCGTERSQHKNRIIALEMVEYGCLAAGLILENSKKLEGYDK
jgi:protein subunit release factor A